MRRYSSQSRQHVTTLKMDSAVGKDTLSCPSSKQLAASSSISRTDLRRNSAIGGLRLTRAIIRFAVLKLLLFEWGKDENAVEILVMPSRDKDLILRSENPKPTQLA